MSSLSTQHATFTIDRKFDAPLAWVYAAFATEAGKSRWFGGGEKWQPIERRFDFRVGGHEYVKGRWMEGEQKGALTVFDALYLEILPEQRIIYTYDMQHDGRHLSISLATLEFAAAGAATELRLTEQGAFLDGYDDAGGRERGTRELMGRLAASLG